MKIIINTDIHATQQSTEAALNEIGKILRTDLPEDYAMMCTIHGHGEEYAFTLQDEDTSFSFTVSYWIDGNGVLHSTEDEANDQLPS